MRPRCVRLLVCSQQGFTDNGGDLLRAFIVAQTEEEATRNLLLQAYEMRALVCCIDGVDEAAAMKGRIEDLVLKTLVPRGIRTVVSSRPEGVRLERYKTFGAHARRATRPPPPPPLSHTHLRIADGTSVALPVPPSCALPSPPSLSRACSGDEPGAAL
jgi:hypothetical protein